MAVICPTVTAFDQHEYRRQIERLQPFAKRIHIDLMDGEFAPTKSPGLDKVWWPEEFIADIHLMYRRPMDQIDQLLKLKPHLVVIHAEAEVNYTEFAARLHQADVKVGLALLHGTPAESVVNIMRSFDHVLVFSGDLGRHGGEADLSLLAKIRAIREYYPDIEISWDGGITDQNARQLADGGIDVLNVGGFIQKSDDPQASYQKISAAL
jgi:ribulose-phosphate 3-epimerase